MKRVFGEAAVTDGDQPRFLAGDFNGDQSQDLAVVVKAAPGKLEEMNAEYPRWMLKDPSVPPASDNERLRVEAGEPLLAIVHGTGAQGWRDAEATQTYLLKNAVGSRWKALDGIQFVKQNQRRNLPRIHGDVIGQVLHGAQGYLYYAGPTYSWYDPQTFTGEPERRMVHGRPKSASDQEGP